MSRGDHRGEYRVLFTRLQDEQWFQQLTGNAQNAYRALKLRLPPHGIAVLYAIELVPRMGRDATPDSVEAGIRELVDVGVVQREGVVVWLVNGLRDEPNMSPNSVLTRRGVQKRVASIPPCSLVAAFREHYPAWFVDAPGIDTPIDTGISTTTVDAAVDVAEGTDTRIDTGIDTPSSKEYANGYGYPHVTATASVSDSDRDPEKGDARARTRGAGKAETADERRKRLRAERLRIALGAALSTYEHLRAWLGPEGQENAARLDVLKRVLMRVIDLPNSEPIDPVTYAGYIDAALGGHGAPSGRPIDGDVVQLGLTDWNTKRPPVEPRLFRAYLTGAKTDATRERAAAKGREPRAASAAASGKLRSM